MAIPRFSEASDKAKVAEAPRILASFESAYLTATAEMPVDSINSPDRIIFDTTALKSKWFNYGFNRDGNKIKGFQGTAAAKIGKISSGTGIETNYVDSTGVFSHGVVGTDTVAMRKYVPNFF